MLLGIPGGHWISGNAGIWRKSGNEGFRSSGSSSHGKAGNVSGILLQVLGFLGMLELGGKLGIQIPREQPHSLPASLLFPPWNGWEELEMIPLEFFSGFPVFHLDQAGKSSLGKI